MIRATTIAACVLALTATGAVAQSMTPNLSSTYIVDEYGRHYNERGDEISRPAMGGKRIVAQHKVSWRHAVPSGKPQAVMAPKKMGLSCGAGSTYLIDEYGRHYNDRGDRIC